MKHFLIFSMLFGLNAFAGTKEITCSFEKIHPSATVTIAVDNIENPEAITTAEVYTDYDGYDTHVTFSGEEDMEWVYYLLMGDSSFDTDDTGNITYWLDSDGCDVGILKLYKNNGYKYGYIKVEHRCSGRDYPDTYSKAKCTVSDYKGEE